MKTRAFYFLISLFLLQCIGSCMSKEVTYEIYYVNCGLQTNHIDNSGTSIVIDNSGPIKKEAYGIELTFVRKEDMCLTTPASIFPSFTASYAMGKKAPKKEVVFINKVTSLEVISLTNFDTDHPANSTITDFFKVFNGKNFTSVENYIESFQTTFGNEPLSISCNLLLIKAPENSGNFQFKIIANLNDGTTIETTTSPISLQ